MANQAEQASREELYQHLLQAALHLLFALKSLSTLAEAYALLQRKLRQHPSVKNGQGSPGGDTPARAPTRTEAWEEYLNRVKN